MPVMVYDNFDADGITDEMPEQTFKLFSKDCGNCSEREVLTIEGNRPLIKAMPKNDW